MNQPLAHHIALVTGASRGLGAAIAAELGARGAAIAVNYFENQQRAQTVAEQIRRGGVRAETFKADVRDEKAVNQLIPSIERQLGAVDILVINATGPQPFLSLEELNWQACQDQLEFFVKSPLLLTKAVMGKMKERRWGRIIQIGSEVFERGVPKFSSYVAAKGAQLGLTRSWALELAPWNITVNLVAPGWIPTDRHSNVPDNIKQEYVATVPLKRMGTPRELAATVAFLASDDAAFITGQKISVNGGNTLE
ncbi:MAG TPA: SDR family oxidoreductase [Phycisphaerae bacterium]|nr:SDR family oxidoreductase [Phycisphaerae bacterium]